MNRHIANIDPDSGIRYGYIRGDSIDPDQLHHLLYESGAKDLTYNETAADLRRKFEVEAEEVDDRISVQLAEIDPNMYGPDREALREKLTHEVWVRKGFKDVEDFVSRHVDREMEYVEIDEPIIEGTNDGVSWRTSWLGGALNLFIFHSPVIVRCSLCSPCVPNAGNLDSLGDYETYGVPLDWLSEVRHA